MSGLIVRPGDTLFIRCEYPGDAADYEAAMPGVTVKLTGQQGGPFVYRPDPTPKRYACCLQPSRGAHASWCPLNPLSLVDEDASCAAHGPHPHGGMYCLDCPQCTGAAVVDDAELDALPDEVTNLAAAALMRVREAQARVEHEVPEAGQ